MSDQIGQDTEPRKEAGDRTGIDDPTLDVLIRGLEACVEHGVSTAWVLSDGTHIEPLHLLYEVRAFRRALSTLLPRSESLA